MALVGNRQGLRIFHALGLGLSVSLALSSCASKGDDDDDDSGGAAGSGGSGGSGATGGSGSCKPKTCAGENAECGTLDDGCGKTLECGTCSAPLSCGGDGTANRCTQAYGWTEVPHDASYDVQGIWGSGPDSVWMAAGGGTLLGGAGQIHYYDGVAWDLFWTMATPGFTDAYGVGSDVFVVGYDGQVYQVNLSEINLLDPSSTNENLAVWASATDAVWVTANSTSYGIRYWSGTQFEDSSSQYRSPGNSAVTAIWGSSANDVWASDLDGMLHYDGTGWTRSAELYGSIFGIDGSGPNDVWAVGPRTLMHYDGTTWATVQAGANKGLNDVWVAGPNDVWLVGDAGRIMHGGTGGFKEVPSGITTGLYAIWGASPLDIWAGGEGGTLIRFGPVDEPTTVPDAGACNPQGYGCMDTPCCSPFRCTNIGGGILVCA
jgi:hypothetical protein